MPTLEPEKVLRDWLAGRFPAARVVTETPGNLQDVCPCIRVTRFGGSRERVPTFDNPTLDVDVFHTSRQNARAYAQQVADAILFELPGNTGVLRVAEFSGPSQAAWDNSTLRRFTASYALRLHSPT